MMSPLLAWLLALPGTFLVLRLLSVATNWECARWMRGVSMTGTTEPGQCNHDIIATSAPR